MPVTPPPCVRPQVSSLFNSSVDDARTRTITQNQVYIEGDIVGGSKQGKLLTLNNEFNSNGLYVRTFPDCLDEFEKTFGCKLNEKLGIGIDERYWSSASFIEKGLNSKIHDPHGDRAGLILSSESKLGDFSAFDTATTNVPCGLKPDKYFPENFPKFDMMGAYGATNNDSIFEVDATEVSESEMDALGIPPEHRSIFEFEKIHERFSKERLSGVEIEPTEAKICYQPKDVLGINVNAGSLESVSKAKELREMMLSKGFDLPFVSYNNGQLDVIEL